MNQSPVNQSPINQSPNISVILLAAGGSSRMGRPKQLLRIGPKSLIRRLSEEALACRANEVVVVVGAEAEAMRHELKGLKVTIVENRGWAGGLSTSIATGLTVVSERCEGVLFILCDQPYVTNDLLNLLIERFMSTGAPVVACEYAQTVGIPALFSKSLFPELMRLKGDSGAKSLILGRMEKLERISFPRGIVDIDTSDDLEGLPG